MRYLSLEWIEAVNERVSSSDTLASLAGSLDFAVTQVVTDGPEGDVVYHFRVGGGTASFGPGPASGEDVRLEQSWDTAVAVATGSLGAQELFIKGLVKVSGNVQRLIAAQDVFPPLDEAFQSVRERTVHE